MNIIIWLVVGGLIGMGGKCFHANARGHSAERRGWSRRSRPRRVVLSPLVGVSSRTINQSNFSIASLLVSFLGAVVLLAIVNLVRRGAPR